MFGECKSLGGEEIYEVNFVFWPAETETGEMAYNRLAMVSFRFPIFGFLGSHYQLKFWK